MHKNVHQATDGKDESARFNPLNAKYQLSSTMVTLFITEKKTTPVETEHKQRRSHTLVTGPLNPNETYSKLTIGTLALRTTLL